MRVAIALFISVCLAAGLSAQAQVNDAFMTECLVTNSQQMCACMSGKLPSDQRAAAIVGLRKSNAASAAGVSVDPSKMSPEEMRGLQAIVVAQAYCM